ncbi:flagellar biosynthetic protein FliR [Rhizobium sp. SL86]|jgi:flagellar biosynthetic protein FliR|uniref:flagellar biosynthetic protein FliR n=1 Tax=Rhizobium sp. SL86 TaxID=2995148 RepID=UPI0022744930|nr:flagellar biosynthetic protein FliR [Rhizobium sp. SL86]MCY1664687.1 flagellar biosynthetic protein FliR [Rhizobium sp. SL86]
MITDPQGTVLTLFLAFCRIGGCFMVLPGFSSARVPSNIRLFLSLGLSLAVMPVLWDTLYPRVSATPASMIGLIGSEMLIGIMYGMIARMYVLGLQFAGSILTMSIGFTAPGGHDVLEDMQETSLTSLITFSGLMLLFILDFHHMIFRALIDSYSVTPVGAVLEPQKLLITLTDTLRASTNIMLRLASPFLIYGLLFNVAVGLVNKLAPQVPVYFISTPYLITGGIFMMYLAIAAMIRQFADGFGPIFQSF